MYPLYPHGVKKWGGMTLPAPMDAPPMTVAIGTAIKHPVPDWVKLSFVIFEIREL